LFFSAEAIVQWYFIVGPLLAATVLAFIAFYLWKRRIAGRYTQPPLNEFALLTQVDSEKHTQE